MNSDATISDNDESTRPMRNSATELVRIESVTPMLTEPGKTSRFAENSASESAGTDSVVVESGTDESDNDGEENQSDQDEAADVSKKGSER